MFKVTIKAIRLAVGLVRRNSDLFVDRLYPRPSPIAVGENLTGQGLVNRTQFTLSLLPDRHAGVLCWPNC